MGTDMSPLFPDILDCMNTPSVQIKKLLYLYIVYYARSKLEYLDTLLAHLLTVFLLHQFSHSKDLNDRDVQVKSCALRNMSYVNIPQVIQLLKSKLVQCLRDEDSMVVKTAALAVAKLSMMDSRMLEDSVYLNELYELLGHNDPTVT